MKADMKLIADYGYGVYSVTEGRHYKDARFAVADTQDSDEGFYIEARTLDEATTQAVAHIQWVYQLGETE